MLQANRLKVTEGQLTTIAGKSAGRKVLCSPQALPVFDSLVSLANGGNYWARLIVQGIRGLASGRLHMDNVYVKQGSGCILRRAAGSEGDPGGSGRRHFCVADIAGGFGVFAGAGKPIKARAMASGR